MRILMSGSSGLVGDALYKQLTAQGYEVGRLIRSLSPAYGALDLYWDPIHGLLDLERLESWDAVIHLAGDGISDGRWTKKKKDRIRDSRVLGTTNLTQAFLKVSKPPQVFISASAIGFYGNRGDETLTEKSGPTQEFLSRVCQQWEKASEPLVAKGVRLVHLRFGVILSLNGGALVKIIPPFKYGVGGILGSGKQFMSWVSLDDVLGIIAFVLDQSNVSGPVNVVSPQPVTNSEFTKTLGEVLSRPTLFPVPAFALRLLLGEMADALLLASTKVIPQKLTEAGYKFKYPDLTGEFKHLLK